jgi:AcrR family transcriptional regulator
MSPRKPAVLRDDSGQNLRDYLIATAARLIDQRGSAGLAVRDIAREAQVADGVLYNYFEDKEDLLVHALLAHVGNVMNSAPQLLPPPGEGTVAENLQAFIDGGIATLLRVTPAFAGLIGQPKVLARFHAMVGGDPAFDPASSDGGEAGRDDGEAGRDDGEAGRDDRRGLPDLLTAYLRGEQRLGRIRAGVDIDAAAALIVGAMHGQILPRVLFTPQGSPVTIPPGLSARLAGIVLDGIAPPSRRPPQDGGT